MTLDKRSLAIISAVLEALHLQEMLATNESPE